MSMPDLSVLMQRSSKVLSALFFFVGLSFAVDHLVMDRHLFTG